MVCWKEAHPPKPKKEKKSKLKGDSSERNQRRKYQGNLLVKGKKECNKCKQIKDITCFRLHKDGEGKKPSDYFPWCKECTKNYFISHTYRTNRRSIEEILTYINTEQYCESCGELKGIWNFPTAKEYSKICSSCRRKEKNRRKHIKNKKRPQTENARLKRRISEKIKSALKGKKKGNTEQYLGCSISFLKEWLARQFTENMSWDNYGEWHIDHYIPQSFFASKEEHEWEVCWNYRNLRPLWAKENIEKSNTLPPDWEERYLFIKNEISP